MLGARSHVLLHKECGLPDSAYMTLWIMKTCRNKTDQWVAWRRGCGVAGEMNDDHKYFRMVYRLRMPI